MVLNYPSPACHLPAKIEVRDRPQTGKQSIEQGKARQQKKDVPFPT